MMRTLIVDDEPLSRKLARRLLAREPGVSLIGECGDGIEALASIQAHRPDLVLLDVQMPDMGGFEMLGRLGKAQMPLVIFVTAYDTFAMKAFEAHALDYLLKPLDEDRFHEAMTRARTYFSGARADVVQERLARLIGDLPAPSNEVTRLMAKRDGIVTFIKVNDIDWIEAAGNYVALHVGASKHLVRGRLSELEKRLDPRQFFRVHRSSMVNLDQVREFKLLFKGEGLVVLKSGARIPASRSCSLRLRETLGTAL